MSQSKSGKLYYNVNTCAFAASSQDKLRSLNHYSQCLQFQYSLHNVCQKVNYVASLPPPCGLLGG